VRAGSARRDGRSRNPVMPTRCDGSVNGLQQRL